MNGLSAPPVVLDTDDSVAPLPGETRIRLNEDWRQHMRFGCRLQCFHRLLPAALHPMPAIRHHGLVFIGSGDFHHLSLGLIGRHLAEHSTNLRIVILDNHPDNMRFPWGIHCGSWVAHLARHPRVSEIHVAGICSLDLTLVHAWEHSLAALRAGKLTYWSIGLNTSWASWLGLATRFRNYPDPDSMVAALIAALLNRPQPTYLSLDKDVFAPEVLRTNWDQGRCEPAHLLKILNALHDQLVGGDVSGEVSDWRYRQRWKRWLSAADGQALAPTPATLTQWQARHAAFNLDLLEAVTNKLIG